MSDYFSLGLNIMLLVFIGFGIFWGFIRGLKKTLSRSIFLLITTLLLILLVIPISNAFLKIPFNTSLTIGKETVISGKHTIAELLEIIFSKYIGEDIILKHPNLASNLVKIPVIFTNAIIYLLLFWLLKYLLLPLNIVFTHLFIRKPKNTEEEMGFANIPEDNENTGAFITKSERLSEEQQVDKNQLAYTIDEKKEKKEKTREEIIEAHKVADEKLKELQNKKKVLKQEKKRQKKEFNKKSFSNRLAGSLIGITTGLIITFNTMIPLYGFIDILDNVNKLKLEHISDEEISLSKLTNGGSDDLLKSYDSSVMNFISTYTGMKAVGNKSFDLITTQNIDGQKIVLSEEINAMVTSVQNVDILLGKYKEFTKDGFKNVTQTQLDDLLINTHNVLNACKEVKILNILADYALPLTCSYLIKQDIKFGNNEYVNEMMIAVLTEITNTSDISINEELDKILDIADYVNQQKLLLPILQEKYNDVITLVKIPDIDFGKQIITKILNLKVVDITLPTIFTCGLDIFNKISHMDIDNDIVTKETLTTAITELVDHAFIVSTTLDNNSPIYLTQKSLNATGKLLDTAKNCGLVTSDTYSKIVDWSIMKLRAVINTLLPEEFIDVVNNEVLANVVKVNNWSNEMNIISQALDILKDKENGILGNITDSSLYREGYDIHLEMKENKIINIGKCLDRLEKSTLFGTTTNIQLDTDGEYYKATPMVKLVTALCDYAITTIDDTLTTEDSMLEFKTIITKAKNNIIIASHRSGTESTFFEQEFTSISPLVVEMYNLIDSQNFEITNRLGEVLDLAKHSIMFGNDTTTELVSIALNIVQDEVIGKNYIENTTTPTIEDKIYNLLKSTKANLKEESLINSMLEIPNFWQQEVDVLSELQSLSEDIKELNDIEDISPLSESLDKVFKNNIEGEKAYLIPLDNLKDLLSFSIEEVRFDSPTQVEMEINSMLTTIANNIRSETFCDTDKVYKNYWQIEFKHLTDLSKIEFNDIANDPTTPENEEYKVLDNLDKIGFELDKVTLGYTINADDSISLGINNEGKSTTRASYLIDHAMIRNLTSAGVDEMSSTISNGFTDTTINTAITKALNSISTNLKDTTNIPTISFTNEFNHLNSLADLSDISIDNSIFTSSNTEDLNRLNILGSTLDGIAYSVKNENSEYSYNNDINSKIITRIILNTLIADITPMAKGANEVINSTVDAIKSSIESLGNATLISWEKELNKVHDLVALNETTISELDSPTDEDKLTSLGANIDAIAFNTDIEMSGDIITKEATKYYDGYQYYSTDKYNSIVITRDILKNTVASFVQDAKPASTTALVDEIVNDLIDNTTAYINTTNNVNQVNTYLNFSASFKDLIATKNDIEELEEEFASVNLETLAEEKAKSVDSFLATEQSRLICGIVTTRKVAILILEKLQTSMNSIVSLMPSIPVTFDNTEPGRYLCGLLSVYRARNNSNSTQFESYSYGSSYNMTTDTNTLASDYSNIDMNNPIETLRVSWLEYLNNLIP